MEAARTDKTGTATPAADTSKVNASPLKLMRLQENSEQADLIKPSPVPVYLQAKLTVSPPDDVYEKEADAVADSVMRMPATPSIQRKCTSCEEENLQTKLAGPSIQKKGDNSGIRVSESFTSQLLSTQGSGDPVPDTTRSFMENRFGADFSAVRLHTNNDAIQLSREINAQAFTLGNDIYFNSGKFSPDTFEGKHLLAHELTHTIQQSNESNGIQRVCGSAAIGIPSGCIENSDEVPMRPRYLFETSCDDFATGNELDLRIDAMAIQDGEYVEVHGLASEEGTFEFNRHLSCARALRAKEVIEEVLSFRGVSATIVLYSHGPQTGAIPINRSVAMIRHELPEPVTEEPEPEYTPNPTCNGIYTDGRDETRDGDHDLDKDHHDGERSPDIILYDYVGGETGALIDYNVGFFGGTMFESTNDDDSLYNHFISGDGSRLNFDTSTDMSRIVGAEADFISFAEGFEQAALDHIASVGNLCGFDGDAYLSAHRPGYLNDQLFVWAVMGGYARLDARVVQTSTGISVTYKLYDHYGAGVSDAWSYLLGLSALYYLQHFQGSWGSSYTPFIWSVEINRTNSTALP